MNQLEQKIADLDKQYREATIEFVRKEQSAIRNSQQLMKKIPEIAVEHSELEKASMDIRNDGNGFFYFKIGFTKPKKEGAEPEVILKPWPTRSAKASKGRMPPRFFQIDHLIPAQKLQSCFPDIADKLGPDIADQLCKIDINYCPVEILPSDKAEDLQKRWEQKKEEIASTTRQKNKEREDQLRLAESQTSSHKKEIQEENDKLKRIKEDRDIKITYLQRIKHLPRYKPEISKDKNSEFDEKPFYSLWIEDSPVFLYDGKTIRYLHVRKKLKPLEVKEVDVETVLGGRKELSEKLIGLTPNRFIDRRGYVLTGEQEKIAADIFEHVFTGKEILPHEESSGGYKVKETKRQKKGESETQPRHWSQVYLAQKQPENITLGQLLGSGGSYKAYQYGDKTVVEFDQEGHATYLFETPYFDSLRTWQKTELLESQPEGFQGRLIHKEDRQAWMSGIDDFLCAQIKN